MNFSRVVILFTQVIYLGFENVSGVLDHFIHDIREWVLESWPENTWLLMKLTLIFDLGVSKCPQWHGRKLLVSELWMLYLYYFLLFIVILSLNVIWSNQSTSCCFYNCFNWCCRTKMPRYDDRYGSNTRLYVGHLSRRTRSRDLDHIFSRYGR